ncbi:TIGR04282 family arsenosugar biosynthesis glycosyltransferase [Micromonospora auratinigra]|uniref:DUF2064 domain-containing protein n=1 Tax=Micromonospora auratinigra TaxID=261654 RepID=A0A1A8ZBK9_9ACTN|nr:DUF2064 domain-containing protein [Micromonospora auratinigra]SBT41251.1 hypothetical protein GA0070611_1554 [Micromonospora auratinigra]
MTPVLLVVARAPVPGLVETRLCPPATPDEAAHLAAAALLDTLDAVGATPGVTPVVALTDDLRHAVRGTELAHAVRDWHRLDPRGGTRTDRLVAAHAEVALRFPGRPVLQIGADTPQLRPAVLDRAARRLTGTGTALLGPAADGGWWALGLGDPRQAEALRGVPLSRGDTGLRTRRALRARGLRVVSLPLLSDVDTMADAVAVAATAPHGRFAAAVAAVLAPARGT